MSLKLEFTPAGTPEGFRSSAFADNAEADPDIILRELTQNALDASKDAKRKTTRIRIEIESLSIKDIPALDIYRKRFESACESHAKNGSLEQAETIVEEIRSSIEDGNELQVMWFLDNGIGLDEERMIRLFGDGVGGKTEGSAGSFGVGHLTSFPASNIRYVLYGGVSDSTGKNKTKKSRIFSGHAILAAHTHPINEPYGGIEKSGGGGVDSDRKSHTKTRAYGKDGYLVDDISDRDLFNQRFGFYDEDKCPDIIDDKLDIIERDFGTGSAIGILDFNRFRRFENDDDSIKSIERAIASHFLPLVFDKRLEVEIYLNGEYYSSIDRSSLKSILERDSHKTRSIKNSVGPSGGNIFDAYRTLENPDPESRSISTSMGNISLRFRSLKGSDERSGTRIQLYRNGMWIEDNIPQNNRSEFNRSDPFNALLLLDPAECPKACEIVRKAEGPRHTDIKPSRLAKADQKKLRGLFSEIRDGLLEIAPPREESETAFFSDFFVLAGRDQAQRNSKPKRADQQSSPGPGTRTGSGADKKKPVRSDGLWTFKRQGSQLNTQSSLVAQEGGFRVILRVKEKVRNAELRLALVSGTDVSCDQPIPDEFIEIGQSAKLGNEPIPDESYIEGDGNKARAIVLGKIEPGDGDLDLWIPCAPPIGSKVEVQIVKRAEKNRVQDR